MSAPISAFGAVALRGRPVARARRTRGCGPAAVAASWPQPRRGLLAAIGASVLVAWLHGRARGQDVADRT